MELGSLIRHSNTRRTLPIPSQIPTAPSLLSPKPIHTPIRTTRVVLPHSAPASVLAQTQFARTPRIPVTKTFRALFHRATSTSTISVLQRMIHSLRRPTYLTFKIAPFKTGLVLSSHTKSAPTRRTSCLNPLAIVGMYIYMVSSQLTNLSSRCTQLPLYPQYSGTERHSSSHLGR